MLLYLLFHIIIGDINEFKGRIRYNSDSANSLIPTLVNPIYDEAVTQVVPNGPVNLESLLNLKENEEKKRKLNRIRWLFYDSETTVPSDEIVQKMVEEWPNRPENINNNKNQLNNDPSKIKANSMMETNKVETKKRTSILLGGAMKGGNSQNRPSRRQSSGGLKLETPVIRLGQGRA